MRAGQAGFEFFLLPGRVRARARARPPRGCAGRAANYWALPLNGEKHIKQMGVFTRLKHGYKANAGFK
jgi:hypothetical protein